MRYLIVIITLIGTIIGNEINIEPIEKMLIGQSYNIDGTIKSESIIDSIQFQIIQSGYDVSESFNINHSNDLSDSIDLNQDLGLKIGAKNTVSAGTYVFKIIAYKDSISFSGERDFDCVGGTSIKINKIARIIGNKYCKEVIYDIRGRKVKKTSKGIYFRLNKKLVKFIEYNYSL